MHWLFPCIFPNFSQHKMQHHPPATVTAAQHISGASLNFPRFSSTDAKLFTAVSVSRCSGPSCRSRASRTRRRSGSASAKAPRSTSTKASLGRGSPREPKSSHGSVEEREQCFTLRFHGRFLDPSPWWENEILGFELFWFHLSSCYRLYLLMLFELVVNTVAYCNLQLSLCGFAAFLDANLWRQDNIQFLTQQYMFANVLVSGGTEARTGSVPEVQNGAQGPICRLWHLHGTAALVHDDAYHMAVRWSTMSPTWKTKQFQENGQRYAKSPRCGTAHSFNQKLATGLQSMAPALRDLQPYVFTREGGGGQVFWNWQTFVLNGAGNSSQLIA